MENKYQELKDLIFKRTGLRGFDLVCPREKSFMTTCVCRDGNKAADDNGNCIGCGKNIDELLKEEKSKQGGPKMFATGKWVAIQQEETEEMTPGGIIIPDKHKEKHRPARGKVIVAGTKCEEVKQDDEVIFSKENAFTDVIGETRCVFLHEEDVMVVLNRDYAVNFQSMMKD